jgi:hypothetical protein
MSSHGEMGPSSNRIGGRALATRLAGPGGYYNIGNAIGLCVGLALQVRQVVPGADESLSASLNAAHSYFAGSWSAVALTVATAIFFWSGEEYHRALAKRPPDVARTRRGDFLSGIGAVALGMSLLLMGDPLLAATSGLLHAAGKFGSALKTGPRGTELIRPKIAHLFRKAVLISRFPAVLVALIEIAKALGSPAADVLHSTAMPATLLVCCLLWAWADILLLDPKLNTSAAGNPSLNVRE